MKAWTFALAPALCLLTACAGFSIRYDFDPTVTFTALKTYDWYSVEAKGPGKQGGSENPIMERRIRSAVDRELAARGYRLEPSGEADFLVTAYPMYRDRLVQSFTTLGPGWGAWGPRPWGYGFASGYQEVQSYREGSLVLEVRDRKTRQMVWQAAAMDALSGLSDPKDADEQVAAAVKKLLEKFPPPPAHG